MDRDTVIPDKPIPFMLHILRPYAGKVAFVVLVVTVAQALSSSAPYILRHLVDAVTIAADKEEALAGLTHWGGFYVVITVLMYIGWRISGLSGVFLLAESKSYSYRILFSYLTKHSYAYFSNRFAGSVSNKISHASDGADNLIEQIIWHYYPSVLSIIAAIVLLFLTNLYVGAVFLSLAVILVIANLYLVRRRRPLVLAYAEASSVLRGVGVDVITNIFAVMQYARRPFEIERTDGYIRDRQVKDMRRDLSSELGLAFNNALVTAAILGIMIVVYFAFKAGTMTIGDVVMVMTLLFSTSYHLIFIGNMLNGFIRTYGEIEEGLQEILIGHDIVDAGDAPALNVTSGKLVFDDVTFSYGEQMVFKNFSLTIAPGERVGIVGGSGAGKTTFVSLLLRQHDIQQGAILIDGQNIAEVSQDSLRSAISVVPQDPQLFHRSIRENISYGNIVASDDEIQAAAQTAYVHEFVDALPERYDTLVGERGVKLSGGQRQRVVIARAILKNAPILVLDEATSALDSASEVAIQRGLHALMDGKTVIAIAHRLSTLREMDRIVVLDKGGVAETGTHEELIAHGGVYASLWSHQVGGFLQD